MSISLARAAALSLLLAAPASAQLSVTNATVDGKANIFAAGMSTVPALPGGGGVMPLFVDLLGAASGRTLTFANVTGTTTCNGFAASGADGNTACSGGTNISAYNGISGIQANRTGFLVGLFLGAAAPANPAPATLSFGGTGTSFGFASIAPTIGQLFFVGDGLTGTGSGTQQQFVVPTAATRLYLGFVDGWALQGAPSYFGDNSGALKLDLNVASPAVTATPEPASFALMGAGLLALGGVVRRRRSA